MSNCSMLVSKVGEEASRERDVKSGEFKCKTCNKEFLSFQALGGHRASHKKVKRRMASNLSCSTVRPKLHQCSICGVVFDIGQALGGHMRKHRVSSNENLQIHDQDVPKSNATKRLRFWFDLNLTPYENHLNQNLRTPVLHLFI